MVLVAVAGAPGTGTTTLCRLLSMRLGVPHVYAGRLFRDLAKERGMTLAELGAFAEEHEEVDRELDQRMIDRAREGRVVIEGRMAAWHVREAGADGLKVLLEAPEQVRADRVALREGATDVAAVLHENREREASEAKRYREYYGFDPNDPRHYDLVVDTSDKAPEAILAVVLASIPTRGA